MKQTEIPVLPAEKDRPTHAQKVRLQAPTYLKSVIEDDHALPGIHSLDELRSEQISTLGGGKNAATYLIRTDKEQWIIKLSLDGVEAEAEALKKWHSKGARVPAVIAWGIVPSTRRITPSIKYIVEEAMIDKFGRVAETCESYLVHEPGEARNIGRLMGAELAKMHSATSTRSFGNFADSDANTAAYGTWGNYLLGYLDSQKDYMSHLGVTDDDYATVQKFIEHCQFVKKGVYLHDDFSIRNAAIRPYHNQVFIFDPNPIIGDPSWDAAVIYNNYEFRKRASKFTNDDEDLLNRDRQLLTGFKQSYPELPEHNLFTARLLQAVLQAQYQETKKHRLEFKVRKEFIHDVIQQMRRELRV